MKTGDRHDNIELISNIIYL